MPDYDATVTVPEIDLAHTIARIEQAASRYGVPAALVQHLLHRLLTYDVPRLRAHLSENGLAMLRDHEIQDPDEIERPHDLVVVSGDEQFWAHCSCGVGLGAPIRPNESFDVLAQRWERHVMLGV